jgi:TolB protein
VQNSRVLQRVAGSVLVAWALLVGSADAAPRLALIESGLRGPERLVTFSQEGSARQVLANGGSRGSARFTPFSAPSWAPDGSLIAFSRTVGNRRLGLGARQRIFVVGADGRGLRMIPGTRGGYNPVFSPDGQEIAFARRRIRTHLTRFGTRWIDYFSVSAWIVDLATGRTRQLTRWRDELENSPASFSPDGSVLALSRHVVLNRYEAVALRLDGSGSTVIARNGLDPVYSPDGSRIALTRGHWHVFHRLKGATVGVLTDLFTVRPDGTDLRRLTVTPRHAERFPSWDPSGKRLVYGRVNLFSTRGFLGFGNSVMEINADGTCATRVLSKRNSILYGPTWQPGTGREAGPITC